MVVNGNFAVSSGLKLSEAVVLEKTPDLYLNVVAVKTGNETASGPGSGRRLPLARIQGRGGQPVPWLLQACLPEVIGLD